jgi:hypothetical protein
LRLRRVSMMAVHRFFMNTTRWYGTMYRVYEHENTKMFRSFNQAISQVKQSCFHFVLAIAVTTRLFQCRLHTCP